MTLSDEELTLYAIREAQLILAGHVEHGSHNVEATIEQLIEVLHRSDVVEAVERLEAKIGLRLA